MKNIYCLILVLLVSGCSFCPAPDLPDEILIVPTDVMISECPSASPPTQVEFEAADDVKQLYLMTEAYNAQTKNVDECNIRLYGLQVWKKEQVEKYDKP